MKNKLVIFLIILLTVVNISALSFMVFHRFAHRPAIHDVRPGEKIRFAKRLGLSREQVKELREIRKRFHNETEGLRDSLGAAHKELIEYLRGDTPDTAHIDSLIREISVMQGAMHRHAVYSMLKEKNKLSVEQQQKLMRMFERHVAKGHMHIPGPLRQRHKHGRIHGKKHRPMKPGTIER
jgi:Spy/CpxP family protein refolding chaperone